MSEDSILCQNEQNDLGRAYNLRTCKAKIGNLDYRWIVISKEDVLWFQVPVSNSKAMSILAGIRAGDDQRCKRAYSESIAHLVREMLSNRFSYQTNQYRVETEEEETYEVLSASLGTREGRHHLSARGQYLW